MTSISDTNVVNAPGGLVELAYAEKTANQTITNNATAATVIGPLSFVSDGSPCFVDFFVPRIDSPSATDIYFLIEIDGVSPTAGQGRIWNWTNQTANTNIPASARFRFIPSAGAHTVTIKAFSSGSNVTITCASSNWTPAFLRISKIIQASQLIVQTPNAPLVTSLPSNAIDGQEVRYLADNTNGIIWNLRYRAGSSSAHKWEFIGGPEIVGTTGSGTGGTSWTQAAYPNPITNGNPGILNLPLAGDYNITYTGQLQSAGSGAYNMYIGLLDSSRVLYSDSYFVTVGTFNGARVGTTIRRNNITANQTLYVSYYSGSANGLYAGDLRAFAVPIRVSA
jgi:hypothetical protein